MSDREKHISLLFASELQFRLATAVRLATTLETQPLDFPKEWSHGNHKVSYKEIALRKDQADNAAFYLHNSATFLMAVAIKDAIKAVVSDPKNAPEQNTRDAYQIARLIRNAFAHSPFLPVWSIDSDCRDRVFQVQDIIELNTTNIDATAFDWRHYGGPLAILKLCQYVRFEILKDTNRRPEDREMEEPGNVIYQQGDLILRKISDPE